MNNIAKKALIATAATVLVFGAGYRFGRSNVKTTTTKTSETTVAQKEQTDTRQQTVATTTAQQTATATDHTVSSTTSTTTQAAKVTRTHTKITRKDGTVIEREREVVDNSKHQETKSDEKKDTSAVAKVDIATTATTNTSIQRAAETVSSTKTKEVVVTQPTGGSLDFSLYMEQNVKTIRKGLDPKLNLDIDLKVLGPVFVGGSVSDILSKDRDYTVRAGLRVSF